MDKFIPTHAVIQIKLPTDMEISTAGDKTVKTHDTMLVSLASSDQRYF